MQSITWGPTAKGAVTQPALSAGYNTGFMRSGQDQWQISLTLPDLTGWSSSWHQCTMSDADNGKTLQFEVSGNTFYMNMPSGNCKASMTGSNGYNSLAAIRVGNIFPVPAKVKLTHRYSDDQVFPYSWPGDIAPGEFTPADDYFIVYFNTGEYRTGLDYWNIEVTLNVPPYEKQPQRAFTPWRNGTSDKECLLRVDDINQVITFTIGGVAGWRLALPSGGCTDTLTTPNGYNTTAFIKIQNKFSSAIQKVVLTHRYSDSVAYDQMRSTMTVDQFSDPLVWVEYNTGSGRTGYDYWNVTAYLVNGKYYKNATSEKRCYMTADDASGVLEFSVSDSNFYIGLKSGACNDGMSYQGEVDYFLGRDATKLYSANAYLAAHNAYANFEEGFWYAQQSVNLVSQLARGVSCLLLDIWDYNDDICLIHETSWLKPFAKPQTLKKGLEQVAAYLGGEPNAVVTIVFEDHVPAASRGKIREAFQAVSVGSLTLWDMVFFADRMTKGWNVATQGWPTVQWLIDNKVPLVVFTSVSGGSGTSIFPYQWAYMSENVYGDASLDQETWLNARGESRPLNEKALCALNHFPTFAPTGLSSWLTQWIGQITTTNKLDTATNMAQACKDRWKRWPNYWQVDFFELPNGDPATAVTQINKNLHGLALGEIRIAHGALVARSVEDARPSMDAPRPILTKAWRSVASWLEAHRQEIWSVAACPELQPELRLMSELAALGNYALLTYGLAATEGASPGTAQSEVQGWASRQAADVYDRADAIQAKIGWAALPPDACLKAPVAQAFVSLALASALTGREVDCLKNLVQQLQADPAFIGTANSQGTAETLLLVQLLGLAAPGRLGWAKRISDALLACEGDAPSSAAQYDLCHEIFYGTQFARIAARDLLSDDLVAQLKERLDGLAARQAHLGNRDLAAELLVAYWCVGGAPSEAVVDTIVTPLTKLHLPAFLGEQCCADCEPKTHAIGPGMIASLDQVVALRNAHEIITTALALGMTLVRHGDVLSGG